MELEVVRACYYGLKNATIGLNAQIGGLAIDQTGDLTPPQVAFYNYVDHPWVARKKINREEIESTRIVLPAMVVFLEAAPTIDAEVETIYRDGDFPVSYSYLSIEPDETKRMRDALYTTRALFRFFTQFHANAVKDTLRLRNNVALLFAKNPITPYTPMDSWEAAYLAAATTVTYRCREHLV
jgi:hypothetical protein